METIKLRRQFLHYKAINKRDIGLPKMVDRPTVGVKANKPNA